jgi:hypothetical protein
MVTTTFKNVKIGDRVYSPTFGWGVIEHTTLSGEYPIYVRFFHDSNPTGYTLEGYYYFDLPIQSLFWDKIVIEAPSKPVGIKVINGIEIPDISFKPTVGEYYYVPTPNHPDLWNHSRFCSCEVDDYRSNNSLCYPDTANGKEVAILHSKAMMGIN